MTSTPMNLSTMSDAELEAWREFYEGKETDQAKAFMHGYWIERSAFSERSKKIVNDVMADAVMDCLEERFQTCACGMTTTLPGGICITCLRKQKLPPIVVTDFEMTPQMREEARIVAAKNIAEKMFDVWESKDGPRFVHAHPNGTCECGTRLEWERVSGGYQLKCPTCK